MHDWNCNWRNAASEDTEIIIVIEKNYDRIAGCRQIYLLTVIK